MKAVSIPDGVEYKCIVCDVHLPMWDYQRNTDYAPGQQTGSIMVRTTGNWGSQVWDCCGSPGMMYFAVCDKCIIQKARNIIIDEQPIVEQEDGKLVSQSLVRQGNEHFQEWRQYLENAASEKSLSDYRKKMLSYFKK